MVQKEFLLGYNQEDAQEFYQLVMSLLEKEYKQINTSRLPTPEPDANSNKFVDIRELKDKTPKILSMFLQQKLIQI